MKQVFFLGILSTALLSTLAVAETTGTLTLEVTGKSLEHKVPDCTLLHFHLPEPDPEGQIVSIEMLRSHSATSGPRVAIAGSVVADGTAKGTFGYRTDEDEQWLPMGEDLDEMQPITLTIDGKTLPQWVAAADRSTNEYLVELAFNTNTPLSAFTNSGIKPVGTTAVTYAGQCTVNIPWLPASLTTQ